MLRLLPWIHPFLIFTTRSFRLTFWKSSLHIFLALGVGKAGSRVYPQNEISQPACRHKRWMQASTPRAAAYEEAPKNAKKQQQKTSLDILCILIYLLFFFFFFLLKKYLFFVIFTNLSIYTIFSPQRRIMVWWLMDLLPSAFVSSMEKIIFKIWNSVDCQCWRHVL